MGKITETLKIHVREAVEVFDRVVTFVQKVIRAVLKFIEPATSPIKSILLRIKATRAPPAFLIMGKRKEAVAKKG